MPLAYLRYVCSIQHFSLLINVLWYWISSPLWQVVVINNWSLQILVVCKVQCMGQCYDPFVAVAQQAMTLACMY